MLNLECTSCIQNDSENEQIGKLLSAIIHELEVIEITGTAASIPTLRDLIM